MFFFQSRTMLKGTSIFQGFTDYHCHILPGVDDGVQTMEDSLGILARYEELGIGSVWLTPHIMEDIPNATADLRVRFEELNKAYAADRAARNAQRPGIILNLAAENMLDSIFETRLAENDLLPMSDSRLLVETSYYNPPMNMYELLEKIMSAGYFPVLAHPERYIYMGEREYARIKDMGVVFQLNLFSLLGFYGDRAFAKASYLLQREYYGLCGTDLHKQKVLEAALDSKIYKKDLKNLFWL